MAGAHNLSKDFFELIKDIGESKSKQEEDKIIMREIEVLKSSMPQPKVDSKKMKEFLVRLLYVEMLGHDGSFGYIHAINLTSSRAMLEKRTGYLAVSLMLHQDHELILLLIANIQRDMQSSNYLEVSASLNAVMKLVNADTAPAILDNLIPLFGHSNDLIRKKAVMSAHAFHQKCASSVTHLDTNLRKMLCDKDPGVMGASLHILYDMTKENKEDFKDLVPSYVSILRQIVDHRLPKDYDYHRMPAPWIQIKLLQLLALTGQDDAPRSETMYEVLHDVMKRADMGINVGYAVMYECVRTVTLIYPNVALLDAAATSISRFITSDNHNLKYLGIKSLAAIVQINSKYAAEHQMIVVDCLDDTDETLKRKTLDLLYKMTTPSNVVFIAGKLMDSLEASNDPFLREELVSRVTELAERFAPNNRWFIQTMNSVFEVGGDLVRPEIAHNLMRLIAEGSGGENDEADNELRMYAIREYYEVLSKPGMPELFLQLVCWVLGEYSYVAEEEIEPDDLIARLYDLAERPLEDPATRCYIMSAIAKIIAQTTQSSSDAAEMAKKYASSKHLDLQQRCTEVLTMLDDLTLMSEVLPMDASTEDLEPDEDLAFLDDFVEEAIANGAREYDDGMADMSPRDRELERERKKGNKKQGLLDGIRLDAYETPTTSTIAEADDSIMGGPQLGNHQDNSSTIHDNYGGESSLSLGGNRSSKPVWGPDGLNTLENNTPAPAPSSAGWAPQDKTPEPAPEPTLNQPSFGGRDRGSSYTSSSSQPYKTEEQLKKEKLAAALFDGPAQNDPEPMPFPDKKKKEKKEKKEKKSKKSKKKDESSEEEEVPAKKDKKEKKSKKDKASAQAPPPAPPADDFDDLLGLGMPSSNVSQPAPQPVVQPAVQAAPTDDLMDLLGDAMPAPTQARAPTSQSLLMPASHSAGSLSTDSLPGSIRGMLGGALPWEYQKLAGDTNMEVHVAKVLLPEQLCMLITVVNRTSSATNGAVIQLDPPRGFRIQCMSEPPSDIQNNRICFSTVPEQSQVHAVVQLQMSDLTPSMSMRGQISYMLGGANKSLSFQTAVQVTDLLRPIPMSTPQFGQMWESLGDGRQLVVKPTSVNSTVEFMRRVGSVLHMHPVETIGQECICAGKLAGTDTACLIHAEVDTNSRQLSIICNSPNQALAEMLSRSCATDFK